MNQPSFKPRKSAEEVTDRQLRRWRKKYDEVARAKDPECEGSCWVCYQACKYRRGVVEVYRAGQWRQQPVRYMLCKQHEEVVIRFLKLLERREKNRSENPPEEL